MLHISKMSAIMVACIWTAVAFADAPPEKWWPPMSVHPDSDANHPRHKALKQVPAPIPAAAPGIRKFDWKRDIQAFLDWLDWRKGGIVFEDGTTPDGERSIPVPEPGTLVLVGLGLGMITFMRKK